MVIACMSWNILMLSLASRRVIQCLRRVEPNVPSATCELILHAGVGSRHGTGGRDTPPHSGDALYCILRGLHIGAIRCRVGQLQKAKVLVDVVLEGGAR